MYRAYGDISTNLSPAAAVLGGKLVKEIDRLELPIACFNLIFKGETFRIAGRSYTQALRTEAQKLRYLKVGGFTYLEQNPAKDSKWGKAARDGHKIMWIIQTGNKWVGRVVDGEVKKL